MTPTASACPLPWRRQVAAHVSSASVLDTPSTLDEALAQAFAASDVLVTWSVGMGELRPAETVAESTKESTFQPGSDEARQAHHVCHRGRQIDLRPAGFPVSALGLFGFFVRPALRMMQEQPPLAPPRFEVSLAVPCDTIHTTPSACARFIWEGRFLARITGFQVVVACFPWQSADALLELPPSEEPLAAADRSPAPAPAGDSIIKLLSLSPPNARSPTSTTTARPAWSMSAKRPNHRTAVAAARVVMQPETLAAIRAGDVKKGDVLGTARVAGIMAAKKTHELIPLCHPLLLTKIAVEFAYVEQASKFEQP